MTASCEAFLGFSLTPLLIDFLLEPLFFSLQYPPESSRSLERLSSSSSRVPSSPKRRDLFSLPVVFLPSSLTSMVVRCPSRSTRFSAFSATAERRHCCGGRGTRATRARRTVLRARKQTNAHAGGEDARGRESYIKMRIRGFFSRSETRQSMALRGSVTASAATAAATAVGYPAASSAGHGCSYRLETHWPIGSK